MDALCINGANNNVPYWKGEEPLLSEAFATKDTLQHTFSTRFVCNFSLCLLSETGAPRLILAPHVNHSQQQQSISTSYSFGTCSHNGFQVGLVPDSPLK